METSNTILAMPSLLHLGLNEWVPSLLDQLLGLAYATKDVNHELNLGNREVAYISN